MSTGGNESSWRNKFTAARVLITPHSKSGHIESDLQSKELYWTNTRKSRQAAWREMIFLEWTGSSHAVSFNELPLLTLWAPGVPAPPHSQVPTGSTGGELAGHTGRVLRRKGGVLVANRTPQKGGSQKHGCAVSCAVWVLFSLLVLSSPASVL